MVKTSVSTGFSQQDSYAIPNLIKDITFFNNPTITVSPNGSVSLCSGAATLTASGSNISSYQWYKRNCSCRRRVINVDANKQW
ncbi:MAG: hypothetical protein IPM91_08580 [Bacteroidetes bacterium]|nr:hypothetical protein [Bacteroidota bacterium]